MSRPKVKPFDGLCKPFDGLAACDSIDAEHHISRIPVKANIRLTHNRVLRALLAVHVELILAEVVEEFLQPRH